MHHIKLYCWRVQSLSVALRMRTPKPAHLRLRPATHVSRAGAGPQVLEQPGVLQQVREGGAALRVPHQGRLDEGSGPFGQLRCVGDLLCLDLVQRLLGCALQAAAGGGKEQKTHCQHACDRKESKEGVCACACCAHRQTCVRLAVQTGAQVQCRCSPHRLEGCPPQQQLVRQHTDGPHVHLAGVPLLWVDFVVLRVLLDRAVQDLRGQVVNGAQPVETHSKNSACLAAQRMRTCVDIACTCDSTPTHAEMPEPHTP